MDGGVPDLTSAISISDPVPVFVGTYSHIYQGEYNGQIVAVKVLRHLRSASLRTMRRKVDREREIWSYLDHINIVPLYGYAEGGRMFGTYGALISPWYCNGDAAEYLFEHGPSLSIEERTFLWQGVIAGVNYLHTYEPKIIHGDLKPTNVLIDDDGIPKLCDFGIAHIIFEGTTGMTTTSEHTGTERYLAPELVAADEGTRPTSASDVYAMGCLGLHVLFLQMPYNHRFNNYKGLICLDIRRGIPPATRPPNLTEHEKALWDIIESCWKAEASERTEAAATLASLRGLSSIANSVMSESDELNGSTSIGEVNLRLDAQFSDLHISHDTTTLPSNTTEENIITPGNRPSRTGSRNTLRNRQSDTDPPINPSFGVEGDNGGQIANSLDDITSMQPPWVKVNQCLYNWVDALPVAELNDCLRSYETRGKVNELALTIWTMQVYKRYVRATLTALPPRTVDIMFVPPKIADAINEAVQEELHGEATRMLRELLDSFGFLHHPKLILAISDRDGHDRWEVHGFSLLDGQIITYDFKSDRLPPDERLRDWWPSLRLIFPENTSPLNYNRIHGIALPHVGCAVAAGAIWKNLLMGHGFNRPVDLERVRSHILSDISRIRHKRIRDINPWNARYDNVH